MGNGDGRKACLYGYFPPETDEMQISRSMLFPSKRGLLERHRLLPVSASCLEGRQSARASRRQVLVARDGQPSQGKD